MYVCVTVVVFLSTLLLRRSSVRIVLVYVLEYSRIIAILESYIITYMYFGKAPQSELLEYCNTRVLVQLLARTLKDAPLHLQPAA